MSDILDIIPFNNAINKIKICDETNNKIEEEYSDIIDNSLSDDNSNKNKNRIPKLLVIILCYLNYVNYKKTNKNKILIKSKL